MLTDLELAAKLDTQAAKLISAKQEAAKPEELTEVVQWQKMSYLSHIKLKIKPEWQQEYNL